jgi:hypothetical protein
MTLGAQLKRHVAAGFADQAREHGAELHRRAVEARARDPMATMLLDTFRRKARLYIARAQAAYAVGDRAGAIEQAGWAEMAVENERRVRAAIEGNWDGTGEVQQGSGGGD